MNKYIHAAYVAAGVAVTGSFAALKGFDQLQTVGWWETVVVGAIVASSGAVHNLLVGSDK